MTVRSSLLWAACTLFPVSMAAPSGVESFRLDLPRSKSVVARAGAITVAGSVTSDRVALMQILTPFRLDKYADVVSREEKEAIPRLVAQMVPQDVLIQHVQVNFQRIKGGSILRSYRYVVSDKFDLRSLWGSADFKEILSLVAERSTAGIELSIQGWHVKERQVSSAEYRARRANGFQFAMPLHGGLNDFFLRSVDAKGSTLDIDTVRVYFASTARPAPDSIPDVDETFHGSAVEPSCRSCHTLNVPNTVLQNRGTVERECAPCHQAVLSHVSVHAPASGWDCLSCHDAASSPPYALYRDRTYESELCFTCHAEVKDRLDQLTVAHAPAVAGDCRGCHELHGTDQPSLLHARTNELCLGCHDQVDPTAHPVVGHPLDGRPDPTRAGRSIECVSCHDPHASREPQLLRTSRERLCTMCHAF